MPILDTQLDQFTDKGLYLIFPDGSRLDLTGGKVDRYALQFLEDPAKVPAEVRKAVDFQACSICPKKGTAEFCHSLRPTLYFLSMAEKFSFSGEVTAVYRPEGSGPLQVSKANLRTAMYYVSVLSLIHYCEVGQKYEKYYHGVVPFMEPSEVTAQIYLNIYWHARGNSGVFKRLVTQFKDEIRQVAACQIKRLHLICDNEEWMSLFISTQIAAEFISEDLKSVEPVLKKAFESMN